jgi:hypothetical protein
MRNFYATLIIDKYKEIFHENCDYKISKTACTYAVDYTTLHLMTECWQFV